MLQCYSQSYGNKKAPKKRHIIIKEQYSDKEELQISVHQWMLISNLKQKLQNKLALTGGIQQIRLRYKQTILSNNASIVDYNIKDRSVLFYTLENNEDRVGMIYPYDFVEKKHCQMSVVLDEVRKAFLNKITPKLTDSGISGSYFLENVDRNKVAIFKPLDEEPYAPNNPRGYIGKMGQKGIREGILSGEQGDREVIAYLLDSQQFHGVPPTIFVELYHLSFNANQKVHALSKEDNISQVKRGSLQVFMKHDDECGNYGNSIFSVEEVHKIAILDIRIINCDRNDQNILVKKTRAKGNQKESSKSKSQKVEYTYELIPIDHGLSLPDCFTLSVEEMNWMWWEQAEQPFSQKSLDFISSINIESDLKILTSKFNLREECLLNFRIANCALQKGAKAGLTLKEIGNIIYRPDSDIESPIEKLIQESHRYSNLCLKGGKSDIIKKQIKKAITQVQNNPIKKEAFMEIIKENEEESDIKHFSNGKQQLLKQQNGTSNGQNLNYLNLNTNGIQPLQSEVKHSDLNELSVPQLKQTPSTAFSDSSTSSNLKRSFSLPDLHQNQQDLNQLNNFEAKKMNGNQNQSEKKQVKFEEEDSSITSKAKDEVKRQNFENIIKKSSQNNKDKQEIFMYYLEAVLEGYIHKKILQKQEHVKVKTRGRFNSEELRSSDLSSN